MANKAVPNEIGGTALHPRAKVRTSTLLKDLESVGVKGLVETRSQSDRIRLLATFIYENLNVTLPTGDVDGFDGSSEEIAALGG